MAKIDKEYHKLLNTILSKGTKYEDPNRDGVYRIQIPSYTFKHDFQDGFPAVSTKALHYKSVVGELLWFLRGGTNIKYLIDNGINIWNKDAYNYYLKVSDFEGQEFTLMSFESFIETIKTCDEIDLKHWWKQEGYSTNYTLGDLGRVYGAQWRNWSGIKDSEDDPMYYDIKELDQFSNLIQGLKENPMGTNHIVTAWNPAELNSMALPPCHWSFEILVEPIESNIAYNKLEAVRIEPKIPEYQFTLKWHQRSVDTFLGLPFNIASYATLAEIIENLTGMKAKGIIGDLSNVHIYEPHLDAVKKQLSNDTNKYGVCELSLEDMPWAFPIDSILEGTEIEDFKLEGYESYPRISAEMLPYS